MAPVGRTSSMGAALGRSRMGSKGMLWETLSVAAGVVVVRKRRRQA
jgi:hypothetical protein